MQETIVHVLEAEKKAEEIITKARENSSLQINKANVEISEAVNRYKTAEQIRFNDAIQKMEKESREKIKSATIKVNDDNINLEDVSKKVLNRVLRTVFD